MFDRLTNSDQNSIYNDAVTTSQSGSSNANELSAILSSCTKVPPKSAEPYNIIDQDGMIKYNATDGNEDNLFNLEEKMRKADEPFALSRSQKGKAKWFVDFDIKMTSNKQHVSALFDKQALIKFIAGHILSGVEVDDRIVMYMGITTRDHVTWSDKHSAYKDGIHVYAASIQEQSYRKLKTKEMAEDVDSLAPIFIGYDDIKDNELDLGSSSVHPMSIGASKRGAVSGYTFDSMWKVTYCVKGKTRCVSSAEEVNHDSVNVVSLFSPKHESEEKYIIRPNLVVSMDDEESKLMSAAVEEIAANENDDLSMASLDDPSIREVKLILDCLSTRRSSNREDWKKVMWMLASGGAKFKTVGLYFSAKSPRFRQSEFDRDWEECSAESIRYPGCNMAWLRSIAKEDDEEKYTETKQKLMFDVMLQQFIEIIRFCGHKIARMCDTHIAKSLQAAIPDKYISVPNQTSGGKRLVDDSYVTYYSFIVPGSAEHMPGTACHYRELMTTAPLNKYLTHCFKQMLDYMLTFWIKQMDSPNPREVEKAATARSIIGRAYIYINTDAGKASVLRQFSHLTSNPRFMYELDRHPYAYGGYDCVLLFGVRPRMVTGMTDFKVNRSTMCKMPPFDPDDPIQQNIIGLFLGFFIPEEFDMLLWLLLFWSQACDKLPAILVLLMMVGAGSNGKTCLMELPALAWGDVKDGGRAYKMTIDYLTTKRTSASSAQSELVPLKDATYVTMSEPGPEDKVDTGKQKTLFSGEKLSCRDLYKSEEGFYVNAVFTSGMNQLWPKNIKEGEYELDKGTERRDAVMPARITHTTSPDPSKPTERLANPDIKDKWVRDNRYGSGFLSISGSNHSALITLHGGNMTNVVSPNIRKHTAAYHSRYNTLSKFIHSRCVITGDEKVVNLNVFIGAFTTWYDSNYKTFTHSNNKVTKALYDSPLKKYLKTIGSGENVFVGVRPLGIGQSPSPSETLIKPKNRYEFKHYTDYQLVGNEKLPFDGLVEYTSDPRELLVRLKLATDIGLGRWVTEHGPEKEFPDYSSII
jgi:hypothetical protein